MGYCEAIVSESKQKSVVVSTGCVRFSQGPQFCWLTFNGKDRSVRFDPFGDLRRHLGWTGSDALFVFSSAAGLRLAGFKVFLRLSDGSLLSESDLSLHVLDRVVVMAALAYGCHDWINEHDQTGVLLDLASLPREKQARALLNTADFYVSGRLTAPIGRVFARDDTGRQLEYEFVDDFEELPEELPEQVRRAA